MKIFQLLDNPYSQKVNPYLSTLMDEISVHHKDVEWLYGFDNFWSEKIMSYDILHIHCPDTIINKNSPADIVEKFSCRLEQLKDAGMKIIVTCHNLEPHYSTDIRKEQLYIKAYQSAHLFIHLGNYSLCLLSQKYPSARHIMIPHHAYDTIYRSISDKVMCCRKLHLNPKKKYILSFGIFRDEEEKKLVNGVVKEYHHQGVELLAPRYVRIDNRRNIIKFIYKWFKCRIDEVKHPGLHIYGKFVTDELLPYFFGASDITLIQRNKILNSGNLPLGFYMGNVVVGPNVGNVGEILKETNNPTFEPNDRSSLYIAINEAILQSQDGKGEKNRLYAENHFSTQIVSQQLYDIYNQILVKK